MNAPRMTDDHLGHLPLMTEDLARQVGTVTFDTLLVTLHLSKAKLAQEPGMPSDVLNETPLPRAAEDRLRDLTDFFILGAP